MDENSSPYSDAYLISTTMSLPASSLSICGMQPAAAKSETKKWSLLTDLHDAILWRPRRPKTVHSAYAHVGTELRPDACPEARVRPAPNRYQHVLDDGRPPPLRSRQPTRFGLLLARYRVQLTGGLVSLLVLIPARIRSRMAHDGHQWPANIEFGDVSHTWPRWHSHVSLLRMFLYWVGVTQQKGAASDPF